MTPRFVLTGFASELSLRPLEPLLRARGLPVRLVDLAEEPLTREAVPPGDGPVVLISSQHTSMSGSAYDHHFGFHAEHYAAPQALRDRIAADLLVYVPHDLLEPVLPQEVALLSVFDLFAAPDADWWWAAAHVATVDVGWIGHAVAPSAAPEDLPLEHGVLFITADNWVHAQGGGDFLLRSLAQTLASGIAVKLARWPGVEQLAGPLERAGVHVVDPATPASALIAAAPLVVCNAPSSVLAEASIVGHRPMCVMEPEVAAMFGGQLDAVDVLVCRDEAFTARVPEAGRRAVHPPRFDVDRLLHAIDDALEQRSRPA